MDKIIDYSKTSLTIQQGMVDHVRRFPDKKTRPDHIIWDGHKIKTSDCISVPKEGVITFEILHSKPGTEHGFDAKVDGGFGLEDGVRIPVLRTWKDEKFEDALEYHFLSKNGQIFVWNVYKMHYANGQIVEEKWTGNAGFWVEYVSENERIYHCSSGIEKSPDFESFIFKVKVRSA